jgi:hypothetical protein
MTENAPKPPMNYTVFLNGDTFDRLEEMLLPEDRLTPAPERNVLRFWTINHGAIDFERATGKSVRPLT